jgi:hypothetical protein
VDIIRTGNDSAMPSSSIGIPSSVLFMEDFL